MSPGDDWRRAASTEQMSALTRTVDPTVAHIARVQDYWLGGKDHASVRNTRAFLGRTVSSAA